MTNFVTNAGSGGSTFASDTISTVEYPLAKSAWGAAGAVNQTALAAALPVQPGTAAVWQIQGVQPTATTGTITTATSTIAVAVGQLNLATVTISGTYAGVNATFEQSADGGTTWYACQGSRVDSGVIESVTGVLTANTTRAWDIPIGGATNFRVRATAWTSGTGNIVIAPQSFAYDPCPGVVAQGAAANGSAVAGNPVLIAGSDGTNARSALVDASGRLIISGGAASGATIAGNPVLQGLTFTTTLPTVTTGQAVNAQSTNRGEQLVSISNAGVAAIVTAASTAAAAASPALTVTLSPNSPITHPTPTASAVNSAATTNATSVKASAGTAFSVTCSNTGGAAAFVKLYNLAASPTVGTSVPVLTISVPASGTVNVSFGSTGYRFATGIALAITNLAADTDTTAVAANQVKVLTSYI